MKIRQLICACTGLPRQDLEWLFQFQGVTPADAMATLATMQPTTQVRRAVPVLEPDGRRGRASPPATCSIPDMELGAAYDKAMQTQVFDPLGMKTTTFDYAQGARGRPCHAARARHRRQDRRTPSWSSTTPIIPLRPAGAAWSNVRDMLRYVQMELDEGKLPDGKTVHPEGAAARAARPAGADRQGRHLRDGPDGQHDLRHPGRAPRRRHDRLSQRHDVAAGPERRRGHPDQRRSGLDPAHASTAASSSRCSSTASPRPTRRSRPRRRRSTRSSRPSASS